MGKKIFDAMLDFFSVLYLLLCCAAHFSIVHAGASDPCTFQNDTRPLFGSPSILTLAPSNLSGLDRQLVLGAAMPLAVAVQVGHLLDVVDGSSALAQVLRAVVEGYVVAASATQRKPLIRLVIIASLKGISVGSDDFLDFGLLSGCSVGSENVTLLRIDIENLEFLAG